MFVPFLQLELILKYNLLEEEYEELKLLNIPKKEKRLKITKNTFEKIKIIKELKKFSLPA